MDLQVDFAFETIRGMKRTMIIITDVGTAYTEGTLTTNRDADTIWEALETCWIMRHGAPVSISADDEFNGKKLRRMMRTHDITFKARPTRRHNKTGKVEREIQVVKSIIKRIDHEISFCSAEQILHRAIFFFKLFSGSCILSSFQLARGYQPSVLGIPPSVVPKELLNAHIEQKATRALQRAMLSNAARSVPQYAYRKGDSVWVWYQSSKGNEKDEWVPGVIQQTHDHYLEVTRLKDGKLIKGSIMRPAYEETRLAPAKTLTRELLSCSLEDELCVSADGEGEYHR